MKKILLYFITLAALAMFGLMAWHHWSRDVRRPAKVLYYVDPMNPAHISQEPGIAPCGMKLEPVFEETTSNAGTDGGGWMPESKRALLGVKTCKAGAATLRRTYSWVGKVGLDASKIHQINAPADGRITQVIDAPAGQSINQGEVLAAYYNPEFLHPAQVLVYALNAEEQLRSNLHAAVFGAPAQPNSAYTDKQPQFTYLDQLAMFARTGQLSQSQMTIKLNMDSLKNYGMGELQLAELVAQRRPLDEIRLCAPIGGVLLSRKASPGQVVMKGEELFKVGDLKKLWITVALPQKDLGCIAPGAKARIKSLNSDGWTAAELTTALPQYDEDTLALLLKFAADNRDNSLVPGMLVQVDYSIEKNAAIAVPAEALVDTGKQTIVYVVAAGGQCRPRLVKVAGRWDGQCEIAQGLTAGDEVVCAGNFYVDSESRIKEEFLDAASAALLDPVCGMSVEESVAVKENLYVDRAGQRFGFCGSSCLEQFTRHPEQYAPQPIHESAGKHPADKTVPESRRLPPNSPL